LFFQGSTVQKYPLLRCLAIYRQMPGLFGLTATLFIVVNLSLTVQQWLVGRAVFDVQRGHAVVRLADGLLDYHVALIWLGILAGIALARGTLQYIAGLLALHIGQELLFILREKILVQVQRLDLSYHVQHGAGELVTRTTRDADKVRDALINFWRQVFETSLIVLAAVSILFWYNPLLGAVPLLLTVIGLGIFVLQTNGLVALDRRMGQAYDRVNQDLSEGINGVRVIKSFGLERVRIAGFDSQVTIFVDHARSALAFASSRIPLPQTLIAISHVWVLGCGAVLVAQGRLNLGELVASLLVVTTLVFRVDTIGQVMQIFADARSSAARIWDLLDSHPAIQNGHRALPAASLGVRIENVRVLPPGGGNPVLNQLSLSIAPGEVVALVGATGAGKSTLAGLLPRLVDADSGVVRVGTGTEGWGTDGWHDIRDFDLDGLRRKIHVVPQETFLFSDTLASNLRIAAPEAKDAELLEALRLASAEDVVAGLKDGLETKLGDRGITLSGGQRQRISLARSILSRPALLVLDDATSALDAVTERRVLDNIRGLAREGRAPTLLIISSKLSTIMLADRVLLLAGGRIVEEGRHGWLVRNSAAYRDLMGIEHGQ
jgi:ABC-type multidrug transport system fused ATPase/permease subunit